MTQGLFDQLDEDRWLATQATAGPWSPDAMHGGPVTALVGHVLAATLDVGRLIRCTVDLLGPVPLGELTTEREVVRAGRRSQLGRVVLRAGDRPVATGTGWALAEREVELSPDRPGGAVSMPTLDPPREDGELTEFDPGWEAFNRHIDLQFVDGALNHPGDAAAWVRPRMPLVTGTALDPLARALMAADLSNGISARLPLDRWLYANVDLTVHLRELPEGEWIGLRSETRFGPDGFATATSSLHGAQGAVGSAVQSLFVEAR